MNNLNSHQGQTCVVTGGASFIGSTLVDHLASICKRVVVIDDFSSGRRENLARHEDSDVVEVIVGDLADREFALKSIEACDVIFHLAAVHGGRGFIERYPAAMLTNFAIDFNVLQASLQAKVPRLVHTSSACAYPIGLQSSEEGRGLLEETQAGFDSATQSFPDGTYGWIKLMGEYQFKVAAEAGQITCRSARVFTAYGERENESHAAIALIAKALLRIDPYPIWGSGLQTRNFTHVEDTVSGLLLLGADRRENRYDVFNVGSSTHHTVLEFVETVFDLIGWRPSEIDRQMDLPTGVANRASDNTKILDTFNWEPRIDLREGVARTIQWYETLPTRVNSVDELEQRLLSR